MEVYAVIQDLRISASRSGDTESGKSLRLQIHLPQEGFVAGVGAEEINERRQNAMENQNVGFVQRFLKPVDSYVDFSPTNENLHKDASRNILLLSQCLQFL